VRVASAAKKIENALQDHLQIKDAVGAVGDILGKAIAKKGGGVYQQLKEVTESIQSLKNQVDVLRGPLGRPGISSAERDAIQGLTSSTSKQIDRVEKILELARKAAP
jgi:hypothetical protein